MSGTSVEKVESVETSKRVSLEVKNSALTSAIYFMVRGDAFLGGLLQELTMKYTTQIPAIAGITFNKKTKLFDVYLHDELFTALPLEQRIAVLTHEIYHFLHQHLFRLPFLAKETTQEERMLFNIAGDMAINQLIVNLPHGCVDVANFKLDDGSLFPKHQTMEVYHSLLQGNKKHNQKELDKYQGAKCDGRTCKPGDGQPCNCPPIDTHDWETLSEEEKEEFLNETKKVIKRTIEKTSFSHSTLPDFVKDLLQEIEGKLAALDYKKILRSAISRKVSSPDRETTWTRPSKRYGKYAQGTKVGQLPKLAVLNDSSGSISVEEQNEYLRILDGFLQAGSRNCILGFWHTVLYLLKKYKRGQEIYQSEIESGGTNVGPVLEYIDKTKPDLALILTDGYFDAHNIKPSSEIIWIISKNGNQNHPMKHIGKTILLDKLN